MHTYSDLSQIRTYFVCNAVGSLADGKRSDASSIHHASQIWWESLTLGPCKLLDIHKRTDQSSDSGFPPNSLIIHTISDWLRAVWNVAVSLIECLTELQALMCSRLASRIQVFFVNFAFQEPFVAGARWLAPAYCRALCIQEQRMPDTEWSPHHITQISIDSEIYVRSLHHVCSAMCWR